MITTKTSQGKRSIRSSLNVISMHYKVVLEHSDEGYSVSCPALPGCWSQGESEDEALDNIKNAIEEYLGVLEEQLKDADVREVEVAA